MSSKQEEKVLNDMIKNLRFLKQALEKKFKTKIDANPFDNIISDITKTKSMNYKSQVLSIAFEKENIPKYFAKDRIDTLKIFFSVKVKGNVSDMLEKKDPFNDLEFNIYARGISKLKKPLMYSMHFDRHIEGGNESKEIHPMYHFQFGGRKIEDEEIDRGDVLFLDAPRIMHHPMEFILGLDFLLSNFFPVEWKDISRKNQNYKNIVKEYQKHFILPYFQSVVEHFDRTITPIWNPVAIYPQLIETN